MAKPPSECANVVDLPATSVVDASSSPGESVCCAPDTGKSGHAIGGCGSVRPTPRSFEFLTDLAVLLLGLGEARDASLTSITDGGISTSTGDCVAVMSIWDSSRRCRRRPPQGKPLRPASQTLKDEPQKQQGVEAGT